MVDIKENIEETETEVKEEVKVEKSGGEKETGTDFFEQLSGKAIRLFNENEYSEEEFISMFNLYNDTMKSIEQGNIVQGKIVMITNDSVIVDIGFKSEGEIPISEFGDNPEINEGDTVEIFLDDFENQEGQLVLSKQKADFMKVWDKIKEIHDKGEKVEGRLVRRIKGGIVVDLMGVDAFLPGSQIDIRQVKNFDQYIGENCELMIIKINKLRRNIVVSRRAVIEEEREKMRETVLEDLEIAQVREGSVKNITDFGAFIDLGGVDGLLHITDMSWGRISHPSELVSIGDTINVKILNYEEGKTRISLGMKQLTKYPWDDIEEKYPEGAMVKGKVVSTTDYGAFIELEHGIEGLVHISEMSWTQHVKHPSKIVSVGDVIDVKVLSVDKAEEKISLGIKQLEPDPWATIDERHPSGSHVVGKVRNLTNFGAFVEIEEGIDGLVHISDMSWTKRIKHPSEVMKKSDEVKVIILDIDKDNHRISLGHKQIFDDPWLTLEEKFSVNMITQGTIIRMLDRGVVVELENNIEGFVPTFQLGQDVKKPAEAFNVGEELPLKVIEFDKDQRKIVLSVREYFKEKDKSEFEEFKKKHEPQPVKLGDAFGDILESASGENAKTAELKETEPVAEETDKTVEPEETEAVTEESAETAEESSDIETAAESTETEETVAETAVEAVEESAEEVVEEPVNETAEEPEITDSEETETETTEEAVEESAEEVVEEPVNETAEETVEEVAEEIVEETTDETVKETETETNEPASEEKPEEEKKEA
ncbi:30S ribosomal protein S1 [Candidatus Latescibacterota bacterium]